MNCTPDVHFRRLNATLPPGHNHKRMLAHDLTFQSLFGTSFVYVLEPIGSFPVAGAVPGDPATGDPSGILIKHPSRFGSSLGPSTALQ
jgi:hypothetical protein